MQAFDVNDRLTSILSRASAVSSDALLKIAGLLEEAQKISAETDEVKQLAEELTAFGAVVVVTGKYRQNAKLHLDAFGWEVDHLIGGVWSTGKAEALLLHGASVYVGDHLGDVRGAKAAGAVAVGVTTGPCSGAELMDEGADVVFPDLTEFPAWLRENADRLSAASTASPAPR